MEFAQQLQETAFARWVGESGSLLGYPTILFLHTISMATLAGLSAGIDLRILGVARALPLAPLKRFYPIMWTALAFSAASGLALLIADAVTKLGQTVFWVKILFVVLACITLQLMRRRVFDDPQLDQRPLPSNARALASASLFFWIAATISGRLIAYIN